MLLRQHCQQQLLSVTHSLLGGLHLAQTGIGSLHGAEKPEFGAASILLLTVFRDFLARLFSFK